jgi:glycosyltransferase involved in cell wall biosynthesis
MEIYDDLRRADYVVQLSDTESFCYTMVEALSVGTPVIVCP